MNQIFGKISTEADIWPAAEVEFIRGLSPESIGGEHGEVPVMNSDGVVRNMHRDYISYVYGDTPNYVGTPNVLSIPERGLHNTLIHFFRTGEVGPLKYTLRMPLSWLRLPTQKDRFLMEIDNALKFLNAPNHLNKVRSSITDIVTNHIYLLGSVEVKFWSDPREVFQYNCYQVMSIPEGGDLRTRKPYIHPEQGALIYDDYRAAQYRCGILLGQVPGLEFKTYEVFLPPTVDGLHNLYRRVNEQLVATD